MKAVPYENLEPGKIYYIQCLKDDGDKYLVPNEYIKIRFGIFEKFEDITGSGFQHLRFKWFSMSKIKNIDDVSKIHALDGRTVHLNLNWRFYEMQKFKIQSDMEMRAANLILKNIVRDEYFTWTTML
jgi:hypothetical protein